MKCTHALMVASSLLAALAAPPCVLAQDTSATAAPTAHAALPQVNAEIRKIDVAAGKVTLKHGDIPNLDMPGMTMVFQVRQASQLAGLKVGDKVLFRAEAVNGAYIATDITPQR